MHKNTQFLVNSLFPLFSAAGLYAIYNNETFSHPLSFLIPTALTAGYGFLILIAVYRCDDAPFAEHLIDSVYFLGFLFTLLSLAVMFYRFNLMVSFEDQLLMEAITYVGISVTTSVTGVLLRSMIRGCYLRLHPETDHSLEASYALLKEIAGSFSTSYAETFTAIRDYLDARVQTAAAVDQKEQAYIDALDRFIEASNRYAENLHESRERLHSESAAFIRAVSEQQGPLHQLGRTAIEFTQAAGRLRSDFASLPIEDLNQGLSNFRKETLELDGVLDSLVSILEKKAEKLTV